MTASSMAFLLSMQFSKHLPRARFICASCTRRLETFNSSKTRAYTPQSPRCREYHHVDNASRRRWSPEVPVTANIGRQYSTTGSRRPLRLAIIGSGPAGFYTAHRVMKKLADVKVDMYEQLPVPYGLVRFGVAPDHPEVKNCEDTFEEVASSPRFNYIGNVKVGRDVELVQLKPHYDAILFAYGASEDKPLGISGENRPGVFSAREFVGWYNGLPEFRNLRPDLEEGDQAVIVGQGNVALDVARILLTPVDTLRGTDIAGHALEALSHNKIKSVKVVGRRGPLQASFTVKEARELMHIPGVAFEPIDRSLYPPEIKTLPRVQRRIAEVLIKGTPTTTQESPKSWALSFLTAPKSMDATGPSDHLTSVTFTNQTFAPDTDTLSKSASVVPTDETTVYPASIAFRSVGYKSTPLPGLSDLGIPFDAKLGIIPNDPYGRIVAMSPGSHPHIPGLYCAGWVKRGPTGVIASTMADAFTSADSIAQDWEAGSPMLNAAGGQDTGTGLGWDGVREEVLRRGVRPVSWEDWKRIDCVERARGKDVGKEKEKFASVEEMMAVLDR